MIGDKCGSHTFPYIEVDNSVALEHGATTSKIGEDQIFYCNQRGIGTRRLLRLLLMDIVKIFKQITNGVCR